MGILEQINTIDNEDKLREINKAVVSRIKDLRKIDAIQKKARLKVGMSVSIDHPKERGKTYIIERIKQTNAIVREKDGKAKWNVSMSILNPIN